MSVAAWPNATGEAITTEAQTAITRTPKRLIQFITVLLTSDFGVLSFLCPIPFCVLPRPQGTFPKASLHSRTIHFHKAAIQFELQRQAINSPCCFSRSPKGACPQAPVQGSDP